jgi:predicted nucleic acid-binding protein
MSQAELNALERDVEVTRAKFAHDLARLRSPHSLAEFKEDLWVHARDTKDGIVADLKARAAANPAALAAIAAGVAWRLFHRPPIATALIGLGLFSLLRTSPERTDSETWIDRYAEDPVGELRSRASELADAAKQKVKDLSEQANQAAGEVTKELKERAAAATERATETLREASDAARDRVTRLADDSMSASDRASARLHAAMPDRDDRDNYLLGAAALAVAAAVGIAFQRRA